MISGETADDGGFGTYYGLGYKVEVEKNISAEYGLQLVKVEMYMFDKFITGAIADLENVQGEVNNGNNERNASFIGKILEEITTYMIVEPNEDEIERKTSDKIVVNYGTDYIDYLYGVGRKVLINYDLYYYGLEEVNVSVDNKKISLESVLKSGKVILDGIIAKANKELESNVISGDIYKDGGTMIYNYENYTIIKFHSLDGNQNLYIGTHEMKYNVKNN